jgi:hypothetical protein
MIALHLARGAEHLHALEPRGIMEFLAEFAAATGTEAHLAEHLARWRRLDPALLRAVLDGTTGGRQFPPAVQAVERAA